MEITTLPPAYNVEFKKCKSFSEEFKKNSQEIMTSSTASANSSLASPVDSGVQLLDSESELTSVMSGSGIACDIDSVPSLESDSEKDDRSCFVFFGVSGQVLEDGERAPTAGAG